MGKVIHLEDSNTGGGGGIGTGFGFVEQNYNDLSAISGTSVGQLAYVIDSQGTAWLPSGLGGTYYPKGIYIWDGANWISDRNAISEQLQISIDDIDAVELGLANEITNRTNADINLQNQITSNTNNISTNTSNIGINANDITNLENTKLDSVVGGTDITIDNTDPLNPIINYSGNNTPKIKSGLVLASAFAGNPKKTSAITFTTPFASANYSITLTAHTQNNTTFSIDYESRLAGSFIINTHANNINNLIDVTWIATELGEN